MQVNIENIIVHKRVRKDLGNLEPLKDSLKRYGLLNPITITTKNELIAGQRRLEAAKQLGWTSINAIIIDDIDDVMKLEMELEENTQRSDFSDMELLEGYEQLEKLRNPGFFRRIWNALKAFFARIFEKIAGIKKQ
ncbi:ParB N-terminal domain-containing protein [Treponema brennaborense]|uniref:ParB domain protein nuclease n=1 Tax=Treponema brennaborense (strain DSM 12168 / CIP 105900 / DD5/3) TaxID=906968 RepID=F4LQE8_TREBD|nr:ParB N-terminal domain-containing protein [Treponema brennaborense]AEE17157.1 ParB domain protein nuclease [Treponema brennaborense DSM 12168]